MRTVSSLAVLSGLLVLAACAPAVPDAEETLPPNDPSASSSDSSDAVNDESDAVQAAREALAVWMDADASLVTVVDVEAREWTDGCLGLGGPAESCLAAITPGYLVTLEYNGLEYRYRTDVSGEAVRAEEA